MYFTFEDLFLLYFIIIIRLCNIFYYKRHFSFCTNHEIFGEKVRNDFFFFLVFDLSQFYFGSINLF